MVQHRRHIGKYCCVFIVWAYWSMAGEVCCICTMAAKNYRNIINYTWNKSRTKLEKIKPANVTTKNKKPVRSSASSKNRALPYQPVHNVQSAHHSASVIFLPQDG